jgi:hypothetical protein
MSGVPGAERLQQIGAMEIDGTRADAEWHPAWICP